MRLITFSSDGPGTIEATISDVSAGRVRICLWAGDADTVTDRECRDLRQGSLTRVVADTGRRTWTVSLLGAEGTTSPIAALALRYRSDHPNVTIDGFRFQGTSNAGYNGLEVELQAAGNGRLAIDAQWRGGTQPFRLRIDDVDSGQNVDEVTGEDDRVRYDTELAGASTYAVVLTNEVEFAEVELFLAATLSWP